MAQKKNRNLGEDLEEIRRKSLKAQNRLNILALVIFIALVINTAYGVYYYYTYINPGLFGK